MTTKSTTEFTDAEYAAAAKAHGTTVEQVRDSMRRFPKTAEAVQRFGMFLLSLRLSPAQINAIQRNLKLVLDVCGEEAIADAKKTE